MMAAPRSVAPQPNLAPLIGVIAVVLCVAASMFRLPGFVILLIGLIVAGMMSSAPPLTGKKDAAGYPTIGNPGEHAAVLRHRRWSALRWRLFVPNRDWLFNDPSEVKSHLERANRFANGPLKNLARVLQAAIFIFWLVVPMSFTSIGALGLSAAVFTFPVDALALWVWMPDSGAWLMWPNTVCAYITTVQYFATRRRYAAMEDPAPPVTVGDLLSKFLGASRVKLTVALLLPAVGGASAAIGTWFLTTHLGITWLFVPFPLLLGGVATMFAAVLWRALALPDALSDWRNTVQAREIWHQRWEPLKMDPRPYLTSHSRHGDPAAPLILDTFDAPPTQGASGMVGMGPKIHPLIGAGQAIAVLNEPDVDSSGQPIPGSRHPSRFSVATWPVDQPIDVSDPAVDRGLLRERIRTALAIAGSSYPQLMVTAVEPMWDTEDKDSTAAWSVLCEATDAPAASILPAIAGDVGAALGTDGVYDKKTGLLYVGALTADSTHYVDDRQAHRFVELAREARWSQRWSDVLKMGEARPRTESDVYKTAQLPTGQTIECQPFMTPQGINGAYFLTQQKEKALANALGNAPWVSVIGWEGRGDKAGERHPGAFRVLWSAQPIPLDPARLEPPGRGRPGDALRWAISAAINSGFDAAKLARPEVVAVTALTTADSRGHIWDVRLRLYDGVVLSEVKQKAEKIRGGMGGTPWLRVTDSGEHVRVVVGAVPESRGVEFARPEAKKLTLALDWEQRFTDANLASPVDGVAPRLIAAEPLETNEQVDVLEFTLPRSLAITDFQEQKTVDKLRAASGKTFINVRHNADPSRFTMLVCDVDPMPSPAPFMWDRMGVVAPRSTTFGTRVEGAPVTWHLDNDSHLMVLGQNGSGKGIGMSAMAADNIMSFWDVYAADPIKGFNDFLFADPWLRARATTWTQTVAVVRHLLRLLDEHKKLNEQYGVSNIRDLPDDVRPRLSCLYLDEFTSLVIPDAVVKLRDNADEAERKEYAATVAINNYKLLIGSAIGRILREGRALGLVLVLAGQKLTREELKYIPGGATIKSQMSRLAMGKMSFGDMMSAFADASSALGLLGPSVPRGRGVFESTSESAFAVQTWWAGGSQADHFRILAEKIAEVRPPLTTDEKLDLSMSDSQSEQTVEVFGEEITSSEDPLTEEHEEEIVDVVLNLDDDLEFTFEPDPEPVVGALAAEPPGADAPPEPVAPTASDVGEMIPDELFDDAPRTTPADDLFDDVSSPSPAPPQVEDLFT